MLQMVQEAQLKISLKTLVHNMINTEFITKYNKTLAYIKRKWRPYDEKELQIVQQAAPLLKFMMQKEANAIEDNNIKRILQLAVGMFKANTVIVTQTKLQFINKLYSRDVIQVPSKLAFDSVFEQPGIVTFYPGSYITNVQMADPWSRFEGFITSNSKKCGLYFLNDDNKWNHVKTSPRIISRLFTLGYVSQRGRVPIAANPDVFGIKDVKEIRSLIDYFDNEQLAGHWSKKILKYVDQQSKNYRWPEKKSTNEQILKLLNLKRKI